MITYPAVRQDIAVAVPEEVPAGELVAAAREAAGEELREIRVFDVYRGEQVGAGPQVGRLLGRLPVGRAHARPRRTRAACATRSSLRSPSASAPSSELAARGSSRWRTADDHRRGRAPGDHRRAEPGRRLEALRPAEPLTRQFIERSPFVCVATKLPGGGIDVSPRGDAVVVRSHLDERTLLIPERPGNRLADTLTNLLADPAIGLLFLIPGVGDSFRVNGTRRDHRRPGAARAERRRGIGPAARDPRLDRGGLHAVLEGADPVRALEPERHIERSELRARRDPALADDPSFDADEYDRDARTLRPAARAY